MKTLLIDDDPFALELLALQLQHLGCVALTSCERACDALDLLETRFEAIGQVFCDLQMPGIDATLAMAGQLGMKAVAEGVEVRADWDCLGAMGCDGVRCGAGLFHRPADAGGRSSGLAHRLEAAPRRVDGHPGMSAYGRSEAPIPQRAARRVAQ